MRTYYEYYKKLDTLNNTYKTEYKEYKIKFTVLLLLLLLLLLILLLLISLFSIILFSINIFVASIMFLSSIFATVFVGSKY